MSRTETDSCPLLPLGLQMPRELTTQPTELASVGGGHCHFGQMVPIVANLKPKVRVEEDKGAARSYAHPALCRPHRQGHPATIQLQRQGGCGRESRLGQRQWGQDQAADSSGDASAEWGLGLPWASPRGSRS